MKTNRLLSLWPGMLILVLALTGCVSPGSTDQVEITAIKGRRDPANGRVHLIVSINYSLASSAEGVVALGVDSRESGQFRMMTERRVTRGQGSLDLMGEFQPPEWRGVTAYVNLSEHPHPPRWQPLANTRKPFSPPPLTNAPKP